MAIVTDLQLQQYFETGDFPTQQQFKDLIDSKLSVLAPAPSSLSIGNSVVGGVDKSVLFVGSGLTLQQDVFNFAFDYTNKRLGLGQATPVSRLHLRGETNADPLPLTITFERPAGTINSNTTWIRNAARNSSGQEVGLIGMFQQQSGQGTRFSVSTTTNSATTVATEAMRVSQEKRLSIGNQILNGAVCDIKSEGGLSGNLSIRVKRFDNSTDDFIVDGTGRVLVGSPVSDPSTIVQINSTTRGFLPPRMTTAERNAITATAGLMLYNTDTNQYNFWDGSAWRRFSDAPA